MHTLPSTPDIVVEPARTPASTRLPRLLAKIVFVPLALGAIAVAATGAVLAARGGTMTVIHATDSSGVVVAEGARYVGAAGVVRGVLEAVGIGVAAIAVLGAGAGLRRVAGIAFSAYLCWHGWHALAFAQHAGAERWPWTTVAVIGAGIVASLWLALGPRPAAR